MTAPSTERMCVMSAAVELAVDWLSMRVPGSYGVYAGRQSSMSKRFSISVT